MRRIRRTDRPLGRGGAALVKLATGAAASTSKLEDRYWDSALENAVKPMLTPAGQQTIEAALERLWTANGRAYDVLADAVEATIESSTLDQAGQAWDTLMFVVPLLAWSRTRIASGVLRNAELEALRTQLQAHVFTEPARLTLLNYLLTPDQLPQSYYEETQLARELFAAALEQRDLTLKTEGLPEALDFVSDARFVIGAVAVPRGQSVFSWAEPQGSLEAAQQAWLQQGHDAVLPMLAGVRFEMLMPGAFFATLRKTDRESRLFHIRAGVAYLQASLNRNPAQLGAVFAPFQDKNELLEYRIGLGGVPANEIWHGITWPVMSVDEIENAGSEIREVLTQAGISHIVEHEHRFPLEYSEEYGDPLFPTANGEVVRAELPEELASAPMQLH